MLFKQPDLFLIFLEMWSRSIQTRKSDYCNRLSHLWKLYVIKITLRDFNYSSNWKVRIIVVCLLHFLKKAAKLNLQRLCLACSFGQMYLFKTRNENIETTSMDVVLQPVKYQRHKMVKHTKTICRKSRQIECV